MLGVLARRVEIAEVSTCSGSKPAARRKGLNMHGILVRSKEKGLNRLGVLVCRVETSVPSTQSGY